MRVGALLQREDGTGNVTACAKARWHRRENAGPRGVTRRAGLAQNVVRLKAAPYVVAIVLLAGCGSSSAAARPSPSTSAATSASPRNSPAASPSAQPSPTPTFVGGYGVLVTQGGTDTYTVTLVGVDGKVVASVVPSSPTQVTCGDAAPAVLPLPVSTSDSRVYFLDAQGNVNFLAPNGETGHATRVPAGGQTRSMFAVSPNDQRIAVVQDSYTTSGATTVLYVEDLNGGTNHIKLFSETGAYTLWPIGWRGTNNLVVAKMPSCSSGPGIGLFLNELHVVDPTTGVRRFTIGDGQCPIASSPSPAGAVCENTSFSKANVLNWTGGTVRSYAIQGPVGAYLSPDGMALALVDGESTTFDGVKQTLDLVACGWIDATHVIAAGDTQQQARVGDIAVGSVTPVPAQGTCGGRIPGGL